MIPPFIELGLVLIAASLFGLLARLLKQPALIGYIIAGFVLGPLGYQVISHNELLPTFSEIGITFLLFLVGLELNLSSLKTIGNKIVNLAVLQIVLTFALGYSVGLLFSFSPVEASIIGLALTFSSTIVVLKLISEKNDVQSLYGKLSVALLIIQDIVAVVALALVSGLVNTSNLSLEIFDLLGKIILLFLTAWLASKYILPSLFKWLAKSRDLMIITAVGWCFLFAISAYSLGFSYAIGAFLAGLSLAAIPYNIDIMGQIRPLRDFFIVMFFVLLGFSFNPEGQILWGLVAVLTALALIAKPLIILISLSAQKFKLRTSFYSSFSLGQMSEFSVILAITAASSGIVPDTILSSIIISTAISLAASSYLITESDRLFEFLRPALKFVEPKDVEYNLESAPELVDHVVIFGYHRMGFHILKTLKNLKQEVLVVDFNPDIIENLRKQKIPAIFGDATDSELLDSVQLQNAKMVISTIPHLEENLILTERIREAHKGILMIATAGEISEALKIYKRGADYVILPQLLSGEYISELLQKHEAGTLKKYLNSRANEKRLLRTKKHNLYY